VPTSGIPILNDVQNKQPERNPSISPGTIDRFLSIFISANNDYTEKTRYIT
jgi:hypothetical protein